MLQEQGERDKAAEIDALKAQLSEKVCSVKFKLNLLPPPTVHPLEITNNKETFKILITKIKGGG